MKQTGSDSFALARQEKRQLFQQHWNTFAGSVPVISALIFCSIAQGLFTVFSGSFIAALALNTGILRQEHPLWCDMVILLLQLLISAPGCITVAGLWQIRRKTRWLSDTPPDITGLKWLRRVNLGVCILCGGALAMYPTIIITAGEYLKEEAILQIFYLILAMTLWMIAGVWLIRTVLRNAEENITCCWADTGYILPLILVIAAGVAACLIFTPVNLLCSLCLSLLLLSYGYVLTLYGQFIKKVAARHEAIDRKTIASRENPDDPYNRY